MKELVRKLDMFARITGIELPDWTTDVLYRFLTDIIEQITNTTNKNDTN